MTHELFECRCRAAGALDGRFTTKGSEPQYAPDRSFDTGHIKLDLALDISKKTLGGVCATALRAMADGADKMVFDAVDMQIEFVRSAGKALRYEYDKRKLTVHLKKSVKAGAKTEIVIGYKVTAPKLGLYFVGPDRAYPKKPTQVWTQGEDEYARFWFPCHDAPHERTTTEMIVRVPLGFTAVSNGRLVRRARAGAKALFHWKQDVPHATYLVTLAVGKFSEIRDRWGKVPVQYFCEQGREEDAARAFGDTPKMVEFFSKNIGVPYPFAKYAQVAAVDFIYGGMENTSATTQTAQTLHDERAHVDFSSNPLVAHELAHQWFGDLLTCKEWAHAWLNESFATYFEALYTEHSKGADEFAWELHQNAEAYFEEDKDHYRRAIVTKVYKQPSDLFDRHLYEKGSLVLHMLRALLGDGDFWRVMHTYVKDNRGRAVETQDLLAAIEKATGRNLARFFDQWVTRAGHPEYKVRTWWNAAKKEAHVRVAQTQNNNGETGLFSLPVKLAFYVKGEVKTFTETADKKSHLFKFRLSAEPELVLFDPDHALLKKVDFPKPPRMWERQLRAAKHVMSRVEAAKALGNAGGPAAVVVLKEALYREPFWAVQGAIAEALGAINTPEAHEALLEAHAKLTHPKARRMLISVLGSLKTEEVRERLASTHGDERSYFAEAAAIKGWARTQDPVFLRRFGALIKRNSWNDVLRVAALEALAAFRPANCAEILKRYTAWGHSQNLRMTAARLLGQLGAGHGDAQKYLLPLLRDRYLLVQLTAVKALSKVGDERAVPALEKLTKGDLDGRLKRTAEEAIEKIKKGIEEVKN